MPIHKPISGIHHIITRCTRQFRVRSDCRHRVTRNIDFRKDIYIPIFGIFHQFLDVFLGIKSSIISGLISSRRSKCAKLSFLLYIPGTHLRQLGITLDFYPPTLIIRQVKMHQIILVLSHVINHLHHLFFGEEMTRNINHLTPPSKAWNILNFYYRYTPFYIDNQ